MQKQIEIHNDHSQSGDGETTNMNEIIDDDQGIVIQDGDDHVINNEMTDPNNWSDRLRKNTTYH